MWLYRSTWPPAPTGTVTRLAPVQPGVKLRLDAVGRATPVGYTVRKLADVGAVTVTLRTTAATFVDGTPTCPPRPVICRCSVPFGPSAPACPVPVPSRVSSSRCCVTATYVPWTLAGPYPCITTVRWPRTVLSVIVRFASYTVSASGCTTTSTTHVCPYNRVACEQVSDVIENMSTSVPVNVAVPKPSGPAPSDVIVIGCGADVSRTGAPTKRLVVLSPIPVYGTLDCHRISPPAEKQPGVL